MVFRSRTTVGRKIGGSRQAGTKTEQARTVGKLAGKLYSLMPLLHCSLAPVPLLLPSQSKPGQPVSPSEFVIIPPTRESCLQTLPLYYLHPASERATTTTSAGWSKSEREDTAAAVRGWGKDLSLGESAVLCVSLPEASSG